jgi:hypothetical protein
VSEWEKTTVHERGYAVIAYHDWPKNDEPCRHCGVLYDDARRIADGGKDVICTEVGKQAARLRLLEYGDRKTDIGPVGGPDVNTGATKRD